MPNEEELNRLAYEAQYLQQQAQEMQRQLQQAILVLNNIDATTKTIDGLTGVKEDTFFQIGSDAFVKARPSPDMVLIDVGANVLIEKEPKDAKELLKTRKANMEKAVGVLQRNLEKLNGRLLEIDRKAEELQG
ncbi:MAG TPA: prefoldin subunit alpha [Candidatus Norongarragalinales archaeon]|nr:prefoldin subunit alpha [Candidatus Norongarragalinales archaeon]